MSFDELCRYFEAVLCYPWTDTASCVAMFPVRMLSKAKRLLVVEFIFSNRQIGEWYPSSRLHLANKPHN